MPNPKEKQNPYSLLWGNHPMSKQLQIAVSQQTYLNDLRDMTDLADKAGYAGDFGYNTEGYDDYYGVPRYAKNVFVKSTPNESGEPIEYVDIYGVNGNDSWKFRTGNKYSAEYNPQDPNDEIAKRNYYNTVMDPSTVGWGTKNAQRLEEERALLKQKGFLNRK